MVIGRDTTQSKKRNEKLKKSEERYRSVTEHTGQVIYDSDFRTDKCNWADSIEEVTGYSFEELQKLGKNFWIENIHRTDTNNMGKKFNNEKITGGEFEEEPRLRRKKRACVYIENRGVSLIDQNGQPYGSIGILKNITKTILPDREERIIQTQNEVVNNDGNIPVLTKGTLQDITEYKNAEEVLKLKLKELASSNAELEQFAYVSSHDLQEALWMITGYLQLLQERYQGNLDDKADKYINFAVDGA